VRQLVRDELEELGVGQIDRQHHAIAHRTGEGPDPLRDEVEDDVVLLERRVRGVEDHRNRILHLMIELAGQPVVGALGERGDLLERSRLGFVVIEGEVGRGVELPVEVAVGDLVLAELRLSGGHEGEGERGTEREPGESATAAACHAIQ
jgi:hypothetical protein